MSNSYIKNIKHKKECVISVEFDDGSEGDVDLYYYLYGDKLYRSVRKNSNFSEFKYDKQYIYWDNNIRFTHNKLHELMLQQDDEEKKKYKTNFIEITAENYYYYTCLKNCFEDPEALKVTNIISSLLFQAIECALKYILDKKAEKFNYTHNILYLIEKLKDSDSEYSDIDEELKNTYFIKNSQDKEGNNQKDKEAYKYRFTKYDQNKRFNYPVDRFHHIGQISEENKKIDENLKHKNGLINYYILELEPYQKFLIKILNLILDKFHGEPHWHDHIKRTNEKILDLTKDIYAEKNIVEAYAKIKAKKEDSLFHPIAEEMINDLVRSNPPKPS